MESDVQKLPYRELPPGNMASLFLLYLAYCRTSVDDGSPPASKSTFYGVAKIWSQCLKFRRKSEHAMCVTCSTLKEQIRCTKDLPLVLSRAHVSDSLARKDFSILIPCLTMLIPSIIYLMCRVWQAFGAHEIIFKVIMICHNFGSRADLIQNCGGYTISFPHPP